MGAKAYKSLENVSTVRNKLGKLVAQDATGNNGREGRQRTSLTESTLVERIGGMAENDAHQLKTINTGACGEIGLLRTQPHLALHREMQLVAAEMRLGS